MFAVPIVVFEVLSSSSSFSAIVNVLNAVYCLAQAQTYSSPLNWRSLQGMGQSTSARMRNCCLGVFIVQQSRAHDEVLEFSAFLHLRSTLARPELCSKQILI